MLGRIGLRAKLACKTPSAQAYIAFLHFVKHFPAASSAGPWEPASGAFLPRRKAAATAKTCAQAPHLAGLHNARAIRIPTPDSGVTLGAWHVMPAGAAALDAAAAASSAGAGSDADAREATALFFDELLRGDAAAAGEGVPVAAIYLHGMGETRTKWMSTEHAKLLSSQLSLHHP